MRKVMSLMVRLLVPFLFSLFFVAAQEHPELAGIADLHDVATLADPSVLAQSPVEYSVIRARWQHLEPKEDQYDFSYLEKELALARQHGKKTVLRIIGGRGSPQWILRDPTIPTISFTRKRQDDTIGDITMPIPWNKRYQDEFGELIAKVAVTFGNDIDVVSICGMDQACGLSLGADHTYQDWLAAGYSSQLYLETIKKYMDLYNRHFSHSMLLFHLGEPFEDATIPHEAIVYGRRSIGERFCLFAENLKVSFELPPEPGSKRGMMIDFANQGGCIGYQTVWPVTDDPTNANECKPDERKNDCFLRALKAGIKDGARYFELYEEDLILLPEVASTIQELLKQKPREEETAPIAQKKVTISTTESLEELSPALPCDGCSYEGRCYPVGVRRKDPTTDEQIYCSIDGFQRQKATGKTCVLDYECVSGQCSRGYCSQMQGESKQEGIFIRIIKFFKRLFQ